MRVLQLLCAISFIFFAPGFGSAQKKPRVVHVFVALADNAHQGIIPVSPTLGNGEDAAHNLYWGAAYGVRTFFRSSSDWKEILTVKKPYSSVLERSVFQHRTQNAVLVADAYEGNEIRKALTDFFRTAAGIDVHAGEPKACTVGGVIWCPPEDAELVVYVGHDGLMDFSLPLEFQNPKGASRSAIMLACASKSFFKDLLRETGAQPLLWTTGLMAPEAYTLKAAVDGWILNESAEQIRQRAAESYSRYQKCSLSSASRLFSSSW